MSTLKISRHIDCVLPWDPTNHTETTIRQICFVQIQPYRLKWSCDLQFANLIFKYFQMTITVALEQKSCFRKD